MIHQKLSHGYVFFLGGGCPPRKFIFKGFVSGLKYGDSIRTRPYANVWESTDMSQNAWISINYIHWYNKNLELYTILINICFLLNKTNMLRRDVLWSNPKYLEHCVKINWPKIPIPNGLRGKTYSYPMASIFQNLKKSRCLETGKL